MIKARRNQTYIRAYGANYIRTTSTSLRATVAYKKWVQHELQDQAQESPSRLRSKHNLSRGARNARAP